jgi:hypothetical protein
LRNAIHVEAVKERDADLRERARHMSMEELLLVQA